jgi:betaine-homocysteine S-methyltransferase
MMTLEQRLKAGPVLGAEGYVFELERRGYVQAGPFVPEVILEEPEAVRQLHREFLRAGAEVMVALTYYAHREKMKAVGREGDLEKLNKEAVKLAKLVAAEGDALVAGNICNTWVYDHQRHDETIKEVRAIYTEQVRWAKEIGIDFVIAETLEYLAEARAALEVCRAEDVPVMITFASVHDTTRDGVSYEEACHQLSEEGAMIVGLNCSRGPETIQPILEKIRKRVTGYIAAQPVPYRCDHKSPTFQSLKEGNTRAFPIALDPFLHTRFELADWAVKARDLGVNYIGLCCGAGPHHIRSIAEALGRKPPASRFSPDISLHPMLGKNVKQANQAFVGDWKD